MCGSGVPSFEHWLLGIACFSEFYVDCSTTLLSHGPQVQLTLQSLPESSWLEDVLAYVRFDCEAVVRQEAEARKLFSKYCRNLDSATGLSQGYSGLRPKANPPFTAIPVDERQTATLTCCARDGWGLYRLPAAEFFRPACPAFADQSPAEIGSAQTDDVHGTRLWIRVPSRPLAQEFQLHQVTDAASPRELQRCFTDFWAPIWNRDKGASRSDLSYWEEFLSSLPECPQAAQGLCLPLDDIHFWRAHLRGLKSKTSTGYCGFSNDELKWLPDAPLGDLVRLFHLCGVFGWPKHLGRASVATIAKIACPLGMHHGRPINVFANLYRMWASGVAKAILQNWATWLPDGVKGSIPGRSVRDLSLSLECRVEHSLLERSTLAGSRLTSSSASTKCPGYQSGSCLAIFRSLSQCCTHGSISWTPASACRFFLVVWARRSCLPQACRRAALYLWLPRLPSVGQLARGRLSLVLLLSLTWITSLGLVAASTPLARLLSMLN